MTVGTSRNTRKDDIVLMGGCGYFGGNYKEQHPGAALPIPDMPGPALTRKIGAEEMEYSSTWSDRIQVYADAKKYDVL